MQPRFSITLLVVVAVAMVLGADDPTSAKKTPEAVLKLIRQLGSEEFDEREAASRELAQLDELPEELLRAAESDDAEVARRATAAVRVVRVRAGDKDFAAKVARLDHIKLDRLIALLVAKPDDKGAWESVQLLADEVREQADRSGEREFGKIDLDVAAMPTWDGSDARARRTRIVLGKEKPNLIALDGCVVVCSGPMPEVGSLRNSVVLIDGDFKGVAVMSNCLLVVRGDIGRLTNAANSVIVATGDIVGAKVLWNCYVEAKGASGNYSRLDGCVFVGTAPECPDLVGCITRNGKKGILRMLNFGDPAKKVRWEKLRMCRPALRARAATPKTRRANSVRPRAPIRASARSAPDRRGRGSSAPSLPGSRRTFRPGPSAPRSDAILGPAKRSRRPPISPLGRPPA